MADLKPKRISYKYDLMHLNTPSFASATITWDTSKLTPITKNRVLNALKTGYIRYGRGDAANMYQEIRQRFEIPEFIVRKPIKKKDYVSSGYLHWDFRTEKLSEILNRIYQTERVARRLGGGYIPWYMEHDNLPNDQSYMYIEEFHDLTELEAEIAKITSSDEIKDKREQAIRFIEQGNKITFTGGE
jgi:hypothetical protein